MKGMKRTNLTYVEGVQEWLGVKVDIIVGRGCRWAADVLHQCLNKL